MSESRAGLRYWAFISYSHADEAWAQWLHRSLETWRVPLDRATFRNKLTGQELRESVEKALGLRMTAR